MDEATDQNHRGLGWAEAARSWVAGHRERDLPAAPVRADTIAQWVIDETALQLEIARNRVRLPSTDFRRRLRTEMADSLDLFAARGWLDQPITYHEQPPVLSRPHLDRRTKRGLSFEHLRFDSGYEPHAEEPGRERWLGYERNRTAHAWVLRHPGKPRPWIVCQNGYRTGSPPGDITAFRAMHLHHHLGLNVAMPVLPLHGPRREGFSGDRVLYAGALNIVHTGAQAAWDIRRLLTWIRGSQGAPAVALQGVSLGGFMCALTASLDGDLAAVIAGIPESDLVRNTRRTVEPILPPFYEQWGLSWIGLERVTRVVSPLAMTPLVPQDRRFIFAGLVDRWVRPGNVKALWEHWERPAICWYDGGHLTYLLHHRVQRFVDEALVHLAPR